MALRIGLTYNLRDDFPHKPGDPTDICADWDLAGPISGLAAGLERLGHEVVDIGDPRRLLDRDVQADLIFNLAEMIGFRFREALAPALFELLDLPYALSPPDAMVLSLDKNLSNLLVRQSGGRVPDWVVVDTIGAANLDSFLQNSTAGRWIVKPLAEGSSTGIKPVSSCSTHSEVAEQVRHIVDSYRQPAMVQDFLAGRELTIGVVETVDGATAVAPIEVDLSNAGSSNIFHWESKEALGKEAIRCVPVEPSDDLYEPAKRLAELAFTAIGARDCARVDVRCVEGSDRLSFMEINATPGLDPDSIDAFGIDYDELLAAIVASALRRHSLEEAARSSVEVR